MKFALITASVITAFVSTSGMAEEKREADAHQHGHGVLNVALEGETLSIEMETPGADILGFEYKAETAEDKAIVQAARDTLGDPIGLFGLSNAAGCSITDAEIEIGADETDHDDHAEDEHHDDDHAEHKHDEDEHEKHEHDEDEHHDDHAEEDGHSEVHAHYTLTCTAPAKLSGLNLTTFFAAFPNAEELDAAVLTDDGQASGEITPASPALTF